MKLLSMFFVLLGVSYIQEECTIHVSKCRCKKRFKKVIA